MLPHNAPTLVSRNIIIIGSAYLLFSSACDSRRFGVNCEKECHCKNENENCQTHWTKGRCNSGCAPHFTGPTCQGNGFCFSKPLICSMPLNIYTVWLLLPVCRVRRRRKRRMLFYSISISKNSHIQHIHVKQLITI